jgi:hypothetical protein
MGMTASLVHLTTPSAAVENRDSLTAPNAVVSLLPRTLFFSYQHEDDDADEIEAAHRGRIQDFFDWFLLYIRCKRCGTLATAADYECA